MANDVKWIKITTDMFGNPKIKHLRRLPDGNSIVLIWVMLLTMAGRCNANGIIYLTESIPYTSSMLADELGFEESTIQLAIKALEQLGMVEFTDDGFLYITGWEEHQNVEGMDKLREQNRARKQKQREKQKKLAETSRDSHVTVTECHATEIERELDKEKEYLSILAGEGDENDEEFSTGFSTDFPTPAHTICGNLDSRQKYLEGEIGRGLVMLSDEQFEHLSFYLSDEELEHYIGVVANQISKGKRYGKTHYQAIMDMASADRRIRK